MGRGFRSHGALVVAAALLGGCAPRTIQWQLQPRASCAVTAEATHGSAQEIQWFSPGIAGDNRLSTWCRTVGAPVIRPLAAPAVGPVDSVAVVSWNVHVGGGDLLRLTNDLRAGRLTDGEPVRHFVLLLQEVHRGGPLPAVADAGAVPARVEVAMPSGARQDVVAAAREAGLAIHYVPSMRNGLAGPEEDRGNAVLSNLPLNDPLAIELPFEAQRRVVVGATVRGHTTSGASWRMRLASVHLDTRSTGSRFPATFGHGRLRQARALVHAFPGDLPAVIGGDLNTWSPEILEGAIPLLESYFPDGEPATPEPTFLLPAGIGRRLDHLFFRLPEHWSARTRRIDDRYGSDHYPLLAWVRTSGDGGRDAAVHTAGS